MTCIADECSTNEKVRSSISRAVFLVFVTSRRPNDDWKKKGKKKRWEGRLEQKKKRGPKH